MCKARAKHRPTLFWLTLLVLLVGLSGCGTDVGILSGGGEWQASGLKQSIRALAVNASNPDIVYAGGEQGKVFISTDAGQNWMEQSTGLTPSDPIHMLVFNSANKKLYAATNKSIFVSDGNAQQWSALGLPTDTYTSLDFDPSAATHLYAASMHGGVFISTDEGKTWNATNSGLPQGIAVNGIAFDSSQHQLWSATSAGVYRADDKGANWQARNNGLPTGIITYTVQPAAVVGGDKNLIYLGTNRGVFVSHDQGRHWEQGQNGIQAVSVRHILIDFRRSEGTALYVTSNVGPLRSTDSGETWGSVASGWPKQLPAYDLALGANGYTRLFVATDDVYRYPGDGAGWSLPRILMLLVVVAFFFLLYRLVMRSRRRNFAMKKKTQDSAPPGTPES